jgi:hypothetical protein
VKQHDFHCRENHALGRLLVAEDPAAQVRRFDIEVAGEAVDAAEDQAGTMERARIDARLFGRREGTVARCGSGVSHAAIVRRRRPSLKSLPPESPVVSARPARRTKSPGDASAVSQFTKLLLGTALALRLPAVPMERSVKTRTLQMAASALGGPRKLRDRLEVSSADIAAWLNGTAEPPREIFLRALELILDDLERGPPR